RVGVSWGAGSHASSRGKRSHSKPLPRRPQPPRRVRNEETAPAARITKLRNEPILAAGNTTKSAGIIGNRMTRHGTLIFALAVTGTMAGAAAPASKDLVKAELLADVSTMKAG